MRVGDWRWSGEDDGEEVGGGGVEGVKTSFTCLVQRIAGGRDSERVPQHRFDFFFQKLQKKKEFFLVIILGTEKPSGEARKGDPRHAENDNMQLSLEVLRICKMERDICSSSFSNGNLGGME